MAAPVPGDPAAAADQGAAAGADGAAAQRPLLSIGHPGAAAQQDRDQNYQNDRLFHFTTPAIPGGHALVHFTTITSSTVVSSFPGFS